MNSVTLIGTLLSIDESLPEVRYLRVGRDYPLEEDAEDLLGLVNWNKEAKGEIFSFKEGSLVAVKGRLEIYSGRTVIVTESIQYLGRK